jgi:thymidylate synthase
MREDDAFIDPNRVWTDHLLNVINHGRTASPRGKEVIELTGVSTRINAALPVITLASRKMGFRFMAAEAAWILSGDNKVETIRPYSKEIARYSDNGETFFGAYGPKIAEQWDYAKTKLMEDPSTRQAIINIWRDSPPRTLDVPCTLSMQFVIRDNCLDLMVVMRSSDAWLGWVYDSFTQAMIAGAMCAELIEVGMQDLTLGDVHLYMQNAHIYRTNWEGALAAVCDGRPVTCPQIRFPFDPREFARSSAPSIREELAAHLWMVADTTTSLRDLRYSFLKDVKSELDYRVAAR